MYIIDKFIIMCVYYIIACKFYTLEIKKKRSCIIESSTYSGKDLT